MSLKYNFYARSEGGGSDPRKEAITFDQNRLHAQSSGLDRESATDRPETLLTHRRGGIMMKAAISSGRRDVSGEEDGVSS